MIEIICNEENSDKSKQVTRGAAIRRPKNIKQIVAVIVPDSVYKIANQTQVSTAVPVSELPSFIFPMFGNKYLPLQPEVWK